MMSHETPDDAIVLYQRGREALDQGDTSRAVELFRESVRMEPHFKTLELLGECLLEGGNAAEAVVWLSSAAGLGIRQSRPRYLLARALLMLGDANGVDAGQQLVEALRLNPNFTRARVLLDDLLQRDPGLRAELTNDLQS